ncbi:MAG: translation initiation factor IF-2 [Phycisphaeraceae bacterium]|nr:translation initiation factor IF-2 [Phycisphaeraceae bacterium]
MAKKAAALRVHQVAKELGIDSKEIVAKCQAESIPGITNHMSTVSVGLHATIREWFSAESGGAGTTTVQVAPPVDITRVRRKARRASTVVDAPADGDVPATVHAAEAGPTDAGTGRTTVPHMEAGETPPSPGDRAAEPEDQPVAVAEIAEDRAVPGPTAPAAEPETRPAPMPALRSDDAGSAETAGRVGGAEAEPSARPVRAARAARPAAAAADREPAPTMNVPDRPEVVRPAGERLVTPKKAALAGPRIIRIEKPEVVQAPRRPTRGGEAGTPMGRDSRTGRDAGMAPGGGRPGGGVRGGAPQAPEGRNVRRGARTRTDTGRGGRSAIGFSESTAFNWRQQDLLEREQRLTRSQGFLKAARRDSQKRSLTGTTARAVTPAESGGKVAISEPITIKALSAAAGVKVQQIITALMRRGQPLSTADAVIDTDLAIELMLERGIELEVAEERTAEQEIVEQFRDRAMVDERPRSPVVTILGHVDHGKTSLLDRIRNANVAAGEAGGITQATSAFRVPVHVGDTSHVITFIDTPGHEAFTEMRSRGARVTDIVVLVVAADDGVMPQTIESINHSKAAGVPIIVALNKIDKPEATDSNIQRILGQLAEQELNPVEWGGSTEVVRVSALKGTGIQDLLEILDYQSQLLGLTADFGGAAEGTVLEAKVEEGRGPVANILVQQGLLHRGDFIVAGRGFGRVRDIVTDRGDRVDEAGPGVPATISGLSDVPDAGDRFFIVRTLREAEAAAAERKAEERERSLAQERVTLDNIFQKLAAAQRKELPLIVKADVQGSLETLRATLPKIGSEEVHVVIKHAAVGGISESDVRLAEASGAIIVGFNVTAGGAARKLAESRGVDIRFYDVIYDLTDDVTKAAEGLLAPEVKLEVLGHAEVREVFRVTKVGMVAGCYVTSGTIERHAKIRVTRDGIVIEKDRRLEQLKRFKDDVKEVNAGQECGMRIEGYDDIRAGDVLECYRVREVRRTL